MAKASPTHKLLVLDALRGVAACAVVLYHRAATVPFPKGYLAVDFFFMLSGFVLSFSYQAKLDSGWSTRDFLATRLARLYPLYFLGLVLGFLVALSDPAMRTGVHGWGSAALNLFLLPAWTNPRAGLPYAFPYNIPAWSLLFELLANIVHALFLRRRSTGLLLAILLASAAGLVARTGNGLIDFGANTSELAGGFLRVLFAYVTGMVLYRAWERMSRRPRLWSPILATLLLLTLAGAGASRIGARFDLIAVLGVFPVLLFLAAGSPLDGPMRGMARELGAMSYGIYILHQPVLRFLVLHGWSSPQSGGQVLHIAASACFVGGMLVFVALVDRFYDAPVRELLRRRIAPWPARVPSPELHRYETELR
jgi:peptidoglycan/LPS O-acetylase OafA/YrhL